LVAEGSRFVAACQQALALPLDRAAAPPAGCCRLAGYSGGDRLAAQDSHAPRRPELQIDVECAPSLLNICDQSI